MSEKCKNITPTGLGDRTVTENFSMQTHKQTNQQTRTVLTRVLTFIVVVDVVMDFNGADLI